MVLVGPDGAAGVQFGEFLEPETGLAVQQPPPGRQPLDSYRVRPAVQVLCGQLVDDGGQLGQILHVTEVLQRLLLRQLQPLGRLQRT